MDKFDLALLLNDTLDFDHIAAAIIADTDDRVVSEIAFAASKGEDVDDIDFDAPDVAEEFDDFLPGHMSDRVRNSVSEVLDNSDFSEGKLRVWRSVIVEPNWLESGIDEQALGVSWNFDETCAEADFDPSEGKIEIRLEALTDPNAIDWPRVSYFNTRRPHEREIRLKDTATVELVSATRIERGQKGASLVLSGVYRAGENAEVLTGLKFK